MVKRTKMAKMNVYIFAFLTPDNFDTDNDRYRDE